MLRLSGISKSYGERHALDRVDLEVRPGEIVGVLGENGAGKSTLISIIAGTLRADQGQVLIEPTIRVGRAWSSGITSRQSAT